MATEQTWVIGSIKKNGLSEIRVAVDQYKGKTYVDVRTYYLNDRDEMAPTKKGVALHSLEDVDQVISFLQTARGKMAEVTA
ncbi:MAG: transcriptional coactivator p15/PC4 family protein [Syntrophorhabdales bacterium]